MSKIKKGDEVILRTGKDRGKRGKVVKTLPKLSRVLVEGVNLVTKHIKGSQQEPGKVVKREASVHISNVALYNPTTQKADKIGFKTLEDGRKVRYFKSNQEIVEI